jgi:hypothetical protein
MIEANRQSKILEEASVILVTPELIIRDSSLLS